MGSQRAWGQLQHREEAQQHSIVLRLAAEGSKTGSTM